MVSTQPNITYESESYALIELDPIYSEIIRKADGSKVTVTHPLTQVEINLNDH